MIAHIKSVFDKIHTAYRWCASYERTLPTGQATSKTKQCQQFKFFFQQIHFQPTKQFLPTKNNALHEGIMQFTQKQEQ